MHGKCCVDCGLVKLDLPRHVYKIMLHEQHWEEYCCTISGMITRPMLVLLIVDFGELYEIIVCSYLKKNKINKISTMDSDSGTFQFLSTCFC